MKSYAPSSKGFGVYRSFSKVLAFTHRHHPKAGLQVPAGSIQKGESIKDAARRELFEESGLKFDQPLRLINQFEYFREDIKHKQQRNVLVGTAPSDLPEYWSHEVVSDGEDNGLMFDFKWVSIVPAKFELANSQGKYLAQIFT